MVNAQTRNQVESLLPYMRDVSRCEASLRELNLMWGLIEASAKMNCAQDARTILPTMAATRTQFGQMEQDLVASLVQEKLRNAVGELQTRARYVIDIVVRNLYERTADVGFLATDPELCAYVAAAGPDGGRTYRRLLEYRNKYTVYDEILLLDTEGQVLAQTDPDAPVEFSRDLLLQQTLNGSDYVETFRATDLRPHCQRGLIYSRSMLDPASQLPVGVLCLSFNFEQEMQGIFASHGDPSGRSVMLLLNAEHEVIASSDASWMPLGVRVPTNLEGRSASFIHQGRHYLIATQASSGYQGYPGPPGWLGQAMLPLDVAFDRQDALQTSHLDPELLKGLLSHADSFCPPLHEIMVAAQRIQRIVWNGQVMTAGSERDMSQLKTVLEQISETGRRSSKLFRESIDELYQTVLGTGMTEAGFTARLLVDLLDRNLYERADDCRWWALNPQLRRGMVMGDADARQDMQDVLDYINGLYTVYTRIYVYDANGHVLVNSGAEVPAGAKVDPRTLAAVLNLANTQSYHIEGFAPHALYEDAPTYVYHAAIRHPDDERRTIGGVGLVFDSGPQFQAMLMGAVAQHGDTHALYLTPTGQVLASTHPAHPVGSEWRLPDALRGVPPGEFRTHVGVHAQQYAVMAASTSAGYREFKREDGHQDDVQAVVIRHFGATLETHSGPAVHELTIEQPIIGQHRREFATFLLGGLVLALEAGYVQEAVSGADMRRTAIGQGSSQIGLVRRQAAGERGYVWVHDLSSLLNLRAEAADRDGQVLIVQVQGQVFGLLVDELHAVAEFAEDQIVDSPLPSANGVHLVSRIIRANGGRLPLMVLDGPRLARHVHGENASFVA